MPRSRTASTKDSSTSLVPPKGNANFAWVQYFIHHLAPQGMVGFVLANAA